MEKTMSFESMREWLARRLSHNDDSAAAAGGTSLELLQQDAEARTVTPAVLAEIPTEIGKVVRYVREHRGWSRRDLADLADIDEIDVARIETVIDYAPPPRTVVNLANVCGFSILRFQQLAKHVAIHTYHADNDDQFRFAARSKNVGTVTPEELDTIRALVAVLSEKARDD
jgi:transcriptional regulator with XRE-family HTH domain